MAAAPPRVSAASTRARYAPPLAIGLAAGAALVAAVLLRPEDGALVAGMSLLAIGFAVMAPCSMQMALTMARILERRPGTDLAPAAGRFALGYLGFYLPFALLLGGVAMGLGEHAWVAVALGAVVAVVLGLAVLGAVPLGALSRCRGPLWLLRSGRASFARPGRAGFAFGQYCATCCGPYVLAIAVLAGGTRNFWLAAALVLGYAALMVLPFLAPAVIAPATYSRLGEHAARLVPTAERVTGLALVGLGVALVPAVVAAAVG